MIRAATPSDGVELVPLLEQLGYPTPPTELEARLERLLASQDAGALVAELDGRILGVATFHVFHLIYRPLPHCRLTALVMSSDHRRRGIGAALVAAVESQAIERGCFRLELTTRPGRGEAVAFYAALGFSERPHRLVKSLAR